MPLCQRRAERAAAADPRGDSSLGPRGVTWSPAQARSPGSAGRCARRGVRVSAGPSQGSARSDFQVLLRRRLVGLFRGWKRWPGPPGALAEFGKLPAGARLVRSGALPTAGLHHAKKNLWKGLESLGLFRGPEFTDFHSTLNLPTRRHPSEVSSTDYAQGEVDSAFFPSPTFPSHSRSHWREDAPPLWWAAGGRSTPVPGRPEGPRLRRGVSADSHAAGDLALGPEFPVGRPRKNVTPHYIL